MDPPTSNSKTIPALKTAFLRSQIRLLSTILQPSSTWRSDPSTSTSPSPPTPDTEPLPQKTIDSVLAKLNAHLTTHNQSAYPPQTQRHIAEQIDALYWSDITAHGLNPPEPDEVTVEKSVDISTREGFDSLPETYSDLFLLPRETPQRQQQQEQGGGGGVSAHEAARYAALRERLGVVMVEQGRQRGRLEGYRRLGKLLEPFESAGEDVQPNLVGRDGELGREVERLGVLVQMVQARIGEVGREGGGEAGGRDGEGLGGEREREKLRDVMDVL